MNAPARWYIARSRTRAWGAGSLALLALYAVLVAIEAARRGQGFETLQPWRMGGAGPPAWLAAGTLALGLSLGWLVPGICLALLSDGSLGGPRLLGRALGLGVAYVLGTGVVFAAIAGRAPGRAALLTLLALPALAALGPSLDGHDPPRDWTLPAALLSMIVLTAVAWPKLAWAPLNGDGTEAYELARSLDRSRLPHWDLERPASRGQYGYPAVNPSLTSSHFHHAQMVLLGRAELAARLAFPLALVLAAVLALGLSGRGGPAAIGYVAALVALSALWNAYYVGYEPAYPDLAGLPANDVFMTALWLAGALEIAAGGPALGVAFLLLASGVLYAAPLLASAALVAFALLAGPSGRRALWLWGAGLAAALAAALCVGLATHSLPDWIRQLRSEYWRDFVDTARRTPTLPLLGRFLLATGGLPLVALLRFRRLSPMPAALLLASAFYLTLVSLGQAKNLHYLTPLPFLLAPAALEAAQARLQAVAAVVVGVALALSWPSPPGIRRDAFLLGRLSCLGGVDLEAAALGGDVLYAAFSRPGGCQRFGVGKHTFGRYAIELGGDDCRFRLAPQVRAGWVGVAGADGGLTFSTRDIDEYARWRFSRPPAPASLLFPRARCRQLPDREERWAGRHSLAEPPGSELLLDGFARMESRDPGNPPAYAGLATAPARLLVPVLPGGQVRLRAWAPEGGLLVVGRLNGRSREPLAFAAGWSEITLPSSERGWRQGWNVLELAADTEAARRLALDWIEVAPRPTVE